MRKKTNIWIAIFLFPSILMFIAIYAYPLLTVITTSFTDMHFNRVGKFIGIENYIYLFFKEADLGITMVHTAIWLVVRCTVGVYFGVLVALILSKKPLGWKFTRTAFMLPNIISSAALAVLILGIFNPTTGVVNNIIRFIGFKDFNQNWFYDSSTSFFTVTIADLFLQAVGAILVMAEISSIPDSLFESARIDGATGMQVDRYITIPLLRNIIGTLIILTISSTINGFDFVFLTTKGGPGVSTMNLANLLFRTVNLENNIGLGNAIGVTQLVMGIGLVLLFRKVMKLGQADT